MDSVLSALHEVPGVTASMVFDGSGRLALHKGHAMYDRALCEHVCGVLVKAVDAVQLEQEDWDAITAQFADGKILLRNLGSAHFLAVVTDAALSPTFSTVAMRVAVNKLKKGLEKGTLTGITPVSQPGITPLSPAGFTPLAQPAAARPSPGPEAAAFLTRCVKELARYVGPMSKVYVKEAVGRVCAGAPFTMAAAERLIEDLAQQIDLGDRGALRAALVKGA
jgi:predicted regulator of Ras-like GTPase activity (Roadblock/LC7/MglB family)